jgi:2,3-bisphosphoglycerate-dependent phosphoglycerate mutase
MTTYTLVLVRHGQSTWNLENRFTGWTDVGLTDLGRKEAAEGGRLLREGGYQFDVAYTSVLKRAIHTLNIILDELDVEWLPVFKAWQLNERHYGALQGKDKVQSVAQFGEAQVHQWRRGYATVPPLVEKTDPDFPKFDPRYASVPDGELPRGESLKIVVERVLPYWQSAVVPHIKAGKKILIAAHGNSLRALLKHLEGMSDAEIEGTNIPTGVPRAYKLNDRLLSARHDYVGDPDEIAKRINTVVNQTKKG